MVVALVFVPLLIILILFALGYLLVVLWWIGSRLWRNLRS